MRNTLASRHVEIMQALQTANLPDAARKLGINRVSLFKYLKKNGIDFRRAHTEFNASQLEAVKAFLLENSRAPPRQRLSNAQLATHFGCSMTYIKALKTRFAIPSFSPLKNTDEDWQRACSKLGFTAVTPAKLHTAHMVPVTCFCGVQFRTRVDSVLRGNVKSCGCIVSKPQNDIAARLSALGLEVQTNVIGLLDGRREVDIYIPDRKLAIEYCGLYWHSHSRLQDIQYHESKMRALNAKGIRLLTIFEDEYLEKQEIVWSMLLTKLGLIKTRLSARNCQLTRDRESLVSFMATNHLQGARGRLYYGLQTKSGDIVSAMAFQRNSRLTSGWELSRFASLCGLVVVGAFSKLLAAFVRDYPREEIVSISDNRWSSGDVYARNGFRLSQESPPTYSYIVNKTRMHKKNFCLSKLKAENLWLEGESESETTTRLGLDRIYDCGKKTWILDLDS